VQGDFAELEIEPDDFIYADPPYDVEFTQYSKDAFTWEDQVRVAEWLARHPGPVVLSNQATERIVKLYRKLGSACASSRHRGASVAMATAHRPEKCWLLEIYEPPRHHDRSGA
jgi:site-specific DNA-adenine methylase